MYGELVGKIFELRIENEELAKVVITDYARQFAPGASADDVERMVLQYDLNLSFQENLTHAMKTLS